MSPSILLLVTP